MAKLEKFLRVNVGFPLKLKILINSGFCDEKGFLNEKLLLEFKNHLLFHVVNISQKKFSFKEKGFTKSIFQNLIRNFFCI